MQIQLLGCQHNFMYVVVITTSSAWLSSANTATNLVNANGLVSEVNENPARGQESAQKAASSLTCY